MAFFKEASQVEGVIVIEACEGGAISCRKSYAVDKACVNEFVSYDKVVLVGEGWKDASVGVVSAVEDECGAVVE